MAVPKRKVSKSRRDKRSTGKGLLKKNISFKDGKAFLNHMHENTSKIEKRQARLEKKNKEQNSEVV